MWLQREMAGQNLLLVFEAAVEGGGGIAPCAIVETGWVYRVWECVHLVMHVW